MPTDYCKYRVVERWFPAHEIHYECCNTELWMCWHGNRAVDCEVSHASFVIMVTYVAVYMAKLWTVTILNGKQFPTGS